MKKSLIIASAIASMVTIGSASSALAKTQGHYVGINVLRSSASNQYKSSSIIASNYSKFNDSSIGFGADYKYAFNFDKIFLSPGVFFDKLGLESQDQDGDSVSSDYRYGAKIDLGYDITDDFSLYITSGIAKTGYDVDWKSSGQKESGSKIGYLAGIGASYNISESIALNLEYNSQSIDFKTPDNGGINKVTSDIRAIKFGASYQF